MISVPLASPAHEDPTEPSTEVDRCSPLPSVFIDQSHDFQFSILHVGFVLKYHGMSGTLSSASLTGGLYDNCDVVVTHQGGGDIPFTTEQITNLTSFVKNGGGLLLIGDGVSAQDRLRSKGLQFESWTFNVLASHFGFSFQPARSSKPPVAYRRKDAKSEVSYVPDERITNLGTLLCANGAEPLVLEASGHVVVAVNQYGKGRAAAMADYRFCRTLDDPTNLAFFKGLFLWLGENSRKRLEMPNRDPQELFAGFELHKGWDYEMADRTDLPADWDDRGPQFIWPERLIDLGTVVFRYAQALEDRISVLVERYPDVFQAIFEVFGIEPTARLTIQALPSYGSGYHWSKQQVVAIGCLSESNHVIGVMAHEMVHAWGLPTPRNFAHGWTTFTDDHVARRLRLYPEETIDEKWEGEIEKLRLVDPQLNRLDIAEKATNSEEQRHLDKKVGWMLKELSKRYGIEAFKRFARLSRAAEIVVVHPNPDEPTTSLDDFIYYFSLAVSEDLYPFFERHGASVHPRRFETMRW